MNPGPGIFRTQLPKGFKASGINCGVRRYRPDLGLLVSDTPCIAAGVFTQSTCQAAPVLYDRALLPSDNIRAIITNSGQANAATGEQGIKDNLTMVQTIADALQCEPQQILTASTGVIGEVLEIDKITQAIPDLVKETKTIAEKFALAILTTDLVPKTVNKTISLSQGEVTITGISKGSGMIHPNMATMLGYLTTDVKLTLDQAETLLKAATDNSFNMISVDGETSTNDSVFLLANGASQIALETNHDVEIFQTALTEIAITLAKNIVRDGEGASKLIEIQVQQAPSLDIARQIARSMTISPLIKTAVNGASPNWGRVIARLGMEQVPQDTLEHCTIQFQDSIVFCNNQPQAIDSQTLTQAMQQDTITIVINLNAGEHQATGWGCDLSERYVKINAEYLT